MLFDERRRFCFEKVCVDGGFSLRGFALLGGVTREVEVLVLLYFPVHDVAPIVAVKVFEVSADVDALHVDSNINRSLSLLRPVPRLASLISVLCGEENASVVGKRSATLEVQHLSDHKSFSSVVAVLGSDEKLPLS